MLPVIIFEPDNETRYYLRNSVYEYYRSNPSQMNLEVDTDSLNDVARCLKSFDGITFYMLSIVAKQSEDRRGAVQLGRKILQTNRDNYTVFCLHNAEDLEALLNTGVRPAGVLLRPFPQEKLMGILKRIDRDYETIHEETGGSCLVIDSGNVTYRLPYSSILYIEALDKKLTLWTERQSLTVRMTLNNLVETLPPDLFFRCHRSYMINMKMIDHVDFTSLEVFLTSGDSLPLSKSYKEKLREQLEQERMRGNET